MAHQQDEILDQYIDLVRYLASSLLPEEVDFTVEAEFTRDQVLLKLYVPEEHRGRVIGKGGRIARAMRTLASSAAIPNHLPVSIDIVD